MSGQDGYIDWHFSSENNYLNENLETIVIIILSLLMISSGGTKKLLKLVIFKILFDN